MSSIFILDDDASLNYVMNEWLTTKEFKVFTFTKSEDLFNAFNTFVPDVILLDVLLSEIENGKSVCLELRKRYNYSRKIYLFSVAPLSQSEILHSGADAFIEKPFDIHKLLGMLSNSMSGK
jgi:DNA-binding response OmpR family regulator